MDVVPGKMGQRGINLPAEKTPNVGNPQKTNTKERRRIATTIFKFVTFLASSMSVNFELKGNSDI